MLMKVTVIFLFIPVLMVTLSIKQEGVFRDIFSIFEKILTEFYMKAFQ
jgi:hypothetical protein